MIRKNKYAAGENLPQRFNSNQIAKNQEFVQGVLNLYDSFLYSDELAGVRETKNPLDIFDTAAILTHAAIHEKLEQQGGVSKNENLLVISGYAEYFDNLRKTNPEQFEVEFKDFQDNPPQDYMDAQENLVAEQIGFIFGEDPSQERKVFMAIQEILVKERKPQVMLEFQANKSIPYQGGRGMPSLPGRGMGPGIGMDPRRSPRMIG